MDEHLIALDAANSRIIRAQASGCGSAELFEKRDECSTAVKTAYGSLLTANPERQVFLRVLIRHLDFVERLRTIDILRCTDKMLSTDSAAQAFRMIGNGIMERVER
jgi:hypothetical protein